MKSIKKILFPIDLIENLEPLLPWVTLMVNKFEANLCVLFVTQDLGHFSSFYIPHTNIQEFQEEALKGAQEKMRGVAQEYFKGFPRLETRVEMGDPSTKILEVAEKEGFDLIIMGSHGRRGIERTIFGSVCARVLRDAPCPVLTIRPEKA
ncbi:MAG: universal stress protein [Thermodesulfobacteriota bacterium]